MTIREQIIEANKAYRLGRPVMTDQAFDDLCEAYEKTVSPEEYAAFSDSLHEETGKVSHPFIMGSLDKMKAEEPDKLLAWIAARVLPVAPALSVSAKILGHYGYRNLKNGRIDADDFPEGVGQKTMDAFRACASANFAIVEKIMRDPRYHGAASEDREGEASPVGQKGSVCFIGALDTMSRAEASKRAAAAGYEVKSSVAKGLTYLVTNDPESGSSKNMKSRQLGIKIITEKEFLGFL